MSSRWRVFRRLPPWAILEAGTLISVLVVAGGMLLFAKLVDEVLEGETHAFDQAVLLAFRNPGDLSDPVGPAWLQLMFRDITALGGPTVVTLIAVAVIGFLLIDGKRFAALLMLASVGGGAVLSSVLKLGIDRPRPDLVAHLVEVSTASFPSGHAMLSAVIYLTLGALLSRVEAPSPGQDLRLDRCRASHISCWAESHLSRRSLADGRARRLVRRFGLGNAVLACRTGVAASW